MAQLIHNPAPRVAVLKGMDEIIPNLWLGDIMSTYNIEKIQEKRITRVISLMDQPLPEWLRAQYSLQDIEHIAYQVQDDEIEDILLIMSQVCDAIQEKISGREGVLVHCALGMSRSGSAVIGYCMAAHEFDNKDARLSFKLVMRSHKSGRDKILAFVKQKRPRVQPNAGFWEQLEIWESCQYEVWEEIDGVRKEKAAYKDWKERAEEVMKGRIRRFQ